ncbi:MAG: DUF2235 domain-containing protein [Pseudomonadota bacterium]
MAKSAELEAKEDLAQLGIKKGSRFWPALAAVLAAILTIIFLPHKEPLKKRFVDGCMKAEGLVLQSGISLQDLNKAGLASVLEQTGNELLTVKAEIKTAEDKLKEVTGTDSKAVEEKAALSAALADLKQKQQGQAKKSAQAKELLKLAPSGLKLVASCLSKMPADQRVVLAEGLDRDFGQSTTEDGNVYFKDVGAGTKFMIYSLLAFGTEDPSAPSNWKEIKEEDIKKELDAVYLHPHKLENEEAAAAFMNHVWNWNLLAAARTVSPVVADGTRHLIRDFYFDFSQRVTDLILIILVVALISIIPGIIGMIYRRNFWSWFIVPFGIFLIVSLWGQFGGEPTTGSVMILVLAQAFILLLLLRLRRYSNNDSQLSYGTYNYILATVLGVVAAHWVLSAVMDLPLEGVWDSDLWPLGWYGRLAFIVLILPAFFTLFKRSRAWRGAGSKNIVVCLDGTTNTPDQMEGGRLAQTNVFKLFKMLKSDAPSKEAQTSNYNASISKRYGDRQLGLYYSGVGNKFEYNPIVQMLGGAGGLGAADVVDRAYLDVMRVYRPGDRVFIVGFSRGAAIARLLARALDQRGSPRTVWTLRLFGRHWTIWTSKRDKSKDLEIPVTVLGCWDTVGAFGIAKNIAGIDFQKLDLFKDLTVPDNVEQAYHMVALDEEREEFQPTLMDPDPLAPSRIVEVWFSGDHANIGGGWATTKLSDLTLDFVLRKVSSGYAHAESMTAGDETWGIYLSGVNGETIAPASEGDKPYVDSDGDEPFVLHPDFLGQLRKWSSALYVYKSRELPNHAIVSQTVFDRMVHANPLYAPQSLFNLHDNLTEKRQTVNNAVDRLRETDSLKPDEHQTILEFKDRLQLTRWEEYFDELKQSIDADQQSVWKDPSQRLSNKPKADTVDA